MNGPDSVVVIDDDEAVRESLESLLRAAGYSPHVHATAEDFLHTGRPPGAACMLLDVRLPGMGGLVLQEVLDHAGETLPIVFLTGAAGVPETVRAMKLGAVDFLEKPVEPEALLDAVERALERDAEDRRHRDRLSRIEALRAKLTPRESQVFERVVQGLLNKQIAVELGTTEKTIKVHRGQVMRKMQADSLAHLVRLAAEIGVTEGAA